MSGNLWTWGIDNYGQPLLDAWWTPGWTSQNMAYIQVPPSAFAPLGFPQNLNYVNIMGNYFDTAANPLSGYLTFWPSASLTFTSSSGQITYMPQRYAGVNQTLLGLNQMGDGKIYLWYGQLAVTLLATDNASMSPASFTYHVIEHYKEGLQYDITAPSADVSVTEDIHNLVIPGTVFPASEELPEEYGNERIAYAATSSQYLAIDLSAMSPGTNNLNLTSFEVEFAFMTGAAEPSGSDWIQGSWVNSSAPYVAVIMIGPNGTQLTTGVYRIWVRVSSYPIDDQRPVGWLTIY